ncbi:MAG: transketolase, partial [Nanoarchaeota archaeon]
MDTKKLADIANVLRRDVLQMTTIAGSGHPSSCLSCAEIMAALFFHEMKYDVKTPANADSDSFILSKGHAAPILYAALQRAGCIKQDISLLRKFDSILEGHPLPHKNLPFIDVATGSLGQGLSVGVGMALANKIQKRKATIYVLLGDSELAEGSNYEAMQLASYYSLHNLVAVVDVNTLGQRGKTMLAADLNAYEKRCKGFGWNVIKIDGHIISQIIGALEEAKKSKEPTIILAKTIKGKGVSFIENKNGWHGRVLDVEQLTQALREILLSPFPSIKINAPDRTKIVSKKIKKIIPQIYSLNQEIATRHAYGNAVARLAESDKNVLVLDAEVSNSTSAEKVKEKTPQQFIECFIAEQNMIGMALGLSKKCFNVYASTFAAFLSRAHDQLRMAALSNANVTISGSHAGVSIGEDGPSQMGLEDIALFRTLPTSTILYPADAVSCEKITAECKNISGIKYIRTTRPKTPVIYSMKEEFPIGEYKIIQSSLKDQLILVGAGITLHESLQAYAALKKEEISAAVIDVYCIKPFNEKKFLDFVEKHGKKIIVTEDHYKDGGIGEMLASFLIGKNVKMKQLAVCRIPHSGMMRELLHYEEIDSSAIV